MRIRLVLAGGLAVTAIGIFVALLHAPATVAAGNGVEPAVSLGLLGEGERICQAEEALPAGTSAVRLSLTAVTGPQVNVQVLAGAHAIAHGSRGSAWYGTVVTVPLPAVARTYRDVTVCLQLRFLTGIVRARGSYTSTKAAATDDGQPLPGRLSVSYLRPGHSSWWSQATAIVHHMGLGRAAAGSWIVIPIVLLMVSAIALGSGLILRELK
jgi:hypothetical protein